MRWKLTLWKIQINHHDCGSSVVNSLVLFLKLQMKFSLLILALYVVAETLRALDILSPDYILADWWLFNGGKTWTTQRQVPMNTWSLSARRRNNVLVKGNEFEFLNIRNLNDRF